MLAIKSILRFIHPDGPKKDGAVDDALTMLVESNVNQRPIAHHYVLLAAVLECISKAVDAHFA